MGHRVAALVRPISGVGQYICLSKDPRAFTGVPWPLGLIHSFLFLFKLCVFPQFILEFCGFDWIRCCVTTRGRQFSVRDRNRRGSVEKACG